MDFVVCQGGRCIHARRISVNLNPEPLGWIDSVQEVSEKLAAEVKKLGVAGQSAIVLYHSPSQIVELTGFEVRSARDACNAAKLRCSDSMPVSGLAAICKSSCVGVDSQGRIESFIP